MKKECPQSILPLKLFFFYLVKLKMGEMYAQKIKKVWNSHRVNFNMLPTEVFDDTNFGIRNVQL